MAWKKIMPLLGLAVSALIGGPGCAGVMSVPKTYDYFAAPRASDVWSGKIGQWQQRARVNSRTVASESDATPLLPLQDPPAPELATPSQSVSWLPEESSSGVAAAEVIETQPEAAPIAERPKRLQANTEGPSLELDPISAAPVEPLPSLRQKYSDFRSERRRALARELSDWIQGQARIHYRADGPIDRWATLEETLRSNGDDCDGLELLVFDALLSLGFDRSEVFRAVVYRPEDLQHHMVTLWFEDPSDPWVIDPTGAMTDHMRRMSELPGWVPLKVFGLYREFTVQPARRELAHSGTGSVAQR